MAHALGHLALPAASPPVRPALTAKPFRNPRAVHGFSLRTCSIAGLGVYQPSTRVSTAALAQSLGVSAESLLHHTGIGERRIADATENTSVMASRAAAQALANAGLGAGDVDLIVVATSSPDMPFPATACLVQAQLGARRAAAFDVSAAGAGFLYALELGHQFIASRTYNTVLVIGAEKLSALVDWQDRSTCAFFGDGAGAAVLQNQPEARGLLTTFLGSDGSHAGLMFLPAGGSRCPASTASVADRLHLLRLEGPKAGQHAVSAMQTAAEAALHRCGLTLAQIKCVIPQQASRPIVDSLAKRLGTAPGQMFLNVERFGDTAAASVGIALHEAVASGCVRRGDLVLMTTFGAGLSWAATVVEW
jgi:3-oxoacyl-[acyl-carrier-protein] synthase III